MKVVIILLLLLALTVVNANAIDLGLGGGPEFISLKTTGNKIILELRGDLSPGVNIGTIRGSYGINLFPWCIVSTGYGKGLISFDINNVKGKGDMDVAFVGCEITLIKNISVCIDYNYANFHLSNGKDEKKEKENFLSWGFIWYFK